MEAKKRILLVDDDIDIITVAETILRKENYEVASVSGKDEAIAKLKSEKFDLAILDVMMTTHYEGFEIAAEIFKNPELKNIPFLMQTSIDVLTTTKADVQNMAREFRKDPNYKDLQVLLVKNINDGTAGIDYLTEDGRTVFFQVGGFIRKPIDATKLLVEVKRLIK